KAADDRGSDDWEGRFTSPEAQLFKWPFYEVILVTPFTMVDVNFSGVTTHFTSVPSELPSPPPRGYASLLFCMLNRRHSVAGAYPFSIILTVSAMTRINYSMLFMLC